MKDKLYKQIIASWRLLTMALRTHCHSMVWSAGCKLQ